MYSVINPQGDKSSCQNYLPDSVIIGSSAIKMLFEDMKRSVLKCSKIINLSDNSVRIKRLAKEPGALPEAKKSVQFGDTASIETGVKI